MKKKPNKNNVIFAAGGILQKTIDSVEKIAVVHRKNQKDWCLPKGKPEENETLEKTAVREVGEETGFTGKLIKFAGSVSYKAKGKDKVVLYWYMKAKGHYKGKKAGEVIDKIEWLTPEEAVNKLTYKTESEFIRTVFFEDRPYYLKTRKKSLKYQRLAYAVKILNNYLEYIYKRSEEKRKSAWAHTVNILMEDAKKTLFNRQIDEGWRCYHAARRMSFYGLDKEELRHMACIMRNEAEKLTSWRRKTVMDLLGTKERPVKYPDRTTIYHAALLRDDHFDNQYYKIGLLRGQIKLLAILMLGIISVIICYMLCVHLIPVYHVLIYPGIILFGLLGGCFSSAVITGKPTDKSQIPEVVTNNYFTVLRITIGGASAFIIYFFLQLDIFKIGEFSIANLSTYGFFVIAFISGFSEQLVVNAVRTVLKTK
jgi:8-oxo-dGTP pyrophosphatase MutT (NUDIX family)